MKLDRNVCGWSGVGPTIFPTVTVRYGSKDQFLCVGLCVLGTCVFVCIYVYVCVPVCVSVCVYPCRDVSLCVCACVRDRPTDESVEKRLVELDVRTVGVGS